MNARTTSYRNDGLEFDVLDAGPIDGVPVLLLHGFPQRARSWDQVAPLLHAEGLRTLAPDQRGYSPGARPRRRRDYVLGRLVGDAAALVLAADAGPVHLVGHDWGAAVAWALAASRPDLVRTLTAVSVPHPAAFLQALGGLDQLRRSWYMGFFQLPWLPERMLAGARSRTRVEHAFGMPPAAADVFGDVVADGALHGGLQWYRALPLTRHGLTAGRVRVPTTYVWGDRDDALGRRGATLTERYVDADYRLEVLTGVGHWIPEHHPDVLAALILDRARSV